MRHEVLPQSITAEELGAWITKNFKENAQFVEKIDYEDHEIVEFEHKSCKAGQEIQKLKSLLDEATEHVKKGNHTGADVIIKIPPTEGMNTLEKQRSYNDMQVANGGYEDVTTLYGIPYVDESKMVFVDIEGNHFPDFDRGLTTGEMEDYGNMFAKVQADDQEEEPVGEEKEEKAEPELPFIQNEEPEDEASNF